jgi:hypothetical protein
MTRSARDGGEQQRDDGRDQDRGGEAQNAR